MGTTSDYLIHFNCCKCSTRLRALPAQSGRKLACPKCSAQNLVPNNDRPAAGNKAAPSREKHLDRHEIPVVCRLCSTRMYATATQIGSKVKCPDCDTLTEVREPEKPRPQRAFVAPPEDGDAYRLRDDELSGEAVHSEPEYFIYFCRLCSTQMRATADQVGESVRCPDCDLETTVPAAPARSKPQELVDDGPALAVGAAAEVKETELMEHEKLKVVDSEMVAPAGLRRDYGYANDPIPPKHPFATGVVTFLFYNTTRAMWLALALIIAGVMYLISEIVGSNQTISIATIGSLFIFIPLFVVMVVWTFFWFACQLTIVTETAAGNDKIGQWPELLDFTSWIGSIFYGIVALAASAAPVAMVTAVVSVRPFWLPVASAIGVWLVVPPVLLSMLANGTPLGIYSAETIHRMRRAARSCAAFYATSAGVFLVAVAVAYAVLRFNGIWPAFVVSLVWIPASFVFARLVGRLGWVLSRVSDEHVATGAGEEATAAN